MRLLALWCLLLLPAWAETTVEGTLDAWHLAAAAANEDAYFGYFTPDAVFLGTDATERWTRDEFRAWAKPRFAQGKAWTMKAIRRTVMYSPDRRIAWFDEDLVSQGLGPCRGSGVLLKQTDGTWRIAHYNLAFTVPNEKIDAVKALVAKK